MITKTHLGRSISYSQYRQLVQQLFDQGKTTSHQSGAYLDYTRLNLQRMQRLDKTTVLSPELKKALGALTNNYIWLVLTEGWCGDAAQSLPIMALAENACEQLELRLLLRDENLDVMDHYLTNSSRSIPKLVCLEKATLKERFTWGPRPEAAQQLMLDLKTSGMEKEERSLAIQKWYTNDKTLSLQHELSDLLAPLVSRPYA